MLPVLGLLGIFKKIVEGVIDVAVFLFTNPKFLIALVAIITGVVLYIYAARQIHNLKQEVTVLETQRIIWVKSKAIYESNTRLMKTIAEENQQTLKTLESSVALSNKSRMDLHKKNLESGKKLKELKDYLNTITIEGNPVDKVLSTAVEKIDDSRQTRNALFDNQAWRKK